MLNLIHDFVGLLCLRTQTLEGTVVGALPAGMQALLKRKENFWLIGFATCFSLFAEEKVGLHFYRRVMKLMACP